MPVPIRPVRDIEENVPSVLTDGGFGVMGLSELQIKMLGMDDISRTSAVKKLPVDEKDTELLHEMWSKENDLVLASADDLQELKISVPDTVSDRDIIRMKTNGLVVGPDREVSLTAKGEKALKDKILSQPSNFFLNRTKEKFEFEKEANTKKTLRVIASL